MYVGTPITSAHVPKNIGGPKLPSLLISSVWMPYQAATTKSINRVDRAATTNAGTLIRFFVFTTKPYSFEGSAWPAADLLQRPLLTRSGQSRVPTNPPLTLASIHRESFLPCAFLYVALRRQHKDEKPTHERKAALKPYEAQSIEDPL